tara:strand:+ start:5172 stop:5555 length:384 start_codon:yes stop_codon:yes gene_type:complete
MVEKIRKCISSKRPIVFEDSKIPVWLSKINPIEIYALSFACFVFCRGKLNDTTRRHETIHYHQQLEMLFIGQWLMYGIFWLIGLIKHRDAKKAYYLNPFEKEAYDNDQKSDYLNTRKMWNWINYIKQ